MNPCIQNNTWPLHHLNYAANPMTTASLKPDDIIQQSIASSTFSQSTLGQYPTPKQNGAVDPNANPWNPLVYSSNI